MRTASPAASEQINPLIPQWYDIIGSLICFIVIFAFFWKLVLPRMQKLLDERSAAIEGNIAKASETQAKAEAALEKYTAQLAEARAEAGTIRENAQADGQKIVTAAREQATIEATRIAASAQVQLEVERQAAVVSLRTDVGSLALDLASTVIGETLTDDAKAAAIVDRFLADLETSEKTSSTVGEK